MLGLMLAAVRRHGAPDGLYLDNGPLYSGAELRLVCERVGITLLHARPYDAPARGKMERFWRTLREGCLDHLGTMTQLHDVQARLLARDPRALQRQLAGLASLEAAVRTALRALHATYPALARPQSDDEAFEITTARMLADACNELLVGLDDHRAYVSQRLKVLQHPDQTSWPF